MDKKKNDGGKSLGKDLLNGDPMAKPLQIISVAGTKTDPNGSWTGVPVNPYERPVQDADDL